MRKAQIDCYGFEATSQWFKRRRLEPYLFMHVDDVLDFMGTGPRITSFQSHNRLISGD